VVSTTPQIRHDEAERSVVAAMATHDQEAFRHFYDLYAGRVYRYAILILGDRHLAEDAVQDTMLAAWQGAGRYSGISPVSTWVFGIAHHVVAGIRRKRGPVMAATDAPAPVAGQNDTGPGGAPETIRPEVLGALAALPVPHRQVLFLIYYLDMDQEEAAKVLGVPLGTVKSRLHHARQTLGRMLWQTPGPRRERNQTPAGTRRQAGHVTGEVEWS